METVTMVDPEIRELLTNVVMLRQEISELQKLLREFQNILSEANVRFRPPSPKLLPTN
jgi:hypothetical protein